MLLNKLNFNYIISANFACSLAYVLLHPVNMRSDIVFFALSVKN